MTITNTNAARVTHRRVPGKRADGRKTTVSWPAPMLDALLAQCGGMKGLRPLVNEVMKSVEPKLGYGYSLQVRELTEKLVHQRHSSNT